jgi:hypothetical protein
MNLKELEIRQKTEPIKFPVHTEEKHEAFFRALEKHRKVRYSWKIGVLVVRDCEPIENVEFALAIGRFIPSVEDLIRILAVSGISCRITEWKGEISEIKVKNLESLAGSCRLCLPAPKGKTEHELEKLLRFGHEYLAIRITDTRPIAFPVKAENSENADFFRLLPLVRRVTYNWEKNEMYLIDATNTCRPKTLIISHEAFAKAVGRRSVTSAEMLVLLALSKITFAVTCWQGFFFKETMDRFMDYTDRLRSPSIERA